MTDGIRPPDAREDPVEEHQFVGTLFVLMIYVFFVAGMWAAVYLMLLDR